MNQQTLINELKAYFIANFPHAETTLTPDTDLLSSVLIDSLAIINTTLFIEKQFKIHVGRTDLRVENFSTLQDLAAFIQKRLLES